MRIRGIVETCGKAYDVDDTLVRTLAAGASGFKLGDSLACFVINEIIETFDPKHSELEQFKEVDRCMTRASQQLASVATAARVEWTRMFDAAQTAVFAKARKGKGKKKA